MNRNRLEGICRQFTGIAKEQWGMLTRDSLLAAAGRRDQQHGMVQELRGVSRERLERELEEFMLRHRNWYLSGRRPAASSPSNRETGGGILRILKNYDLLRDPQMDLFPGADARKRPAAG